MSRSRSVMTLALVCLWGVCDSQAEEPAQQPVLVHMQYALDIDVEGRVTNVEFIDDRKLPDALRRDAADLADTLMIQGRLRFVVIGRIQG